MHRPLILIVAVRNEVKPELILAFPRRHSQRRAIGQVAVAVPLILRPTVAYGGGPSTNDIRTEEGSMGGADEVGILVCAGLD